MRNLLAGLIFFSFCFQSCSNSGNKKISDKVAFKSGPMDSLYTKLRPSIQSFRIDNSKVNTIKAVNGTQILIPVNCFVNGYGDLVSENITIEIVEAFSLQDFITGGLATVSGDKLLISNGMMYINARSGEEKLQLDKGASLSVSMPTKYNSDGFQMFTGDGTNWTVDSAMSEMDYAIPLPLNLLYPRGNKDLVNCEIVSGPGSGKTAYYDTSIISYTNSKYENTVIATEEFGRRYGRLMEMMYNMSYFINRDYFFDVTDCFGSKYNYDIWKVYYDHPNRSFRESDSMAKKMYIDYFNTNKDKIAAFYNEVNEHKRKHYINWTDTNYYFDLRKISLKDYYMKTIENFPPENTVEIKAFNNHAVNLDADNAYEELKKKGVDVKEINELLAYNFRRLALIKRLHRAKEVIEDKEKLSKMYESTVFSVNSMGWINCDRFYDDPAAGRANMFVTDGSEKKLNYIDCSLVIPDMNVRLTGFADKPGTYSFTQKDGRYTKLPIGRPAVIVGISLQHDSIFFASKKVNIKNDLMVSLPMKYIDMQGLKDSLKNLLN